MRGLHLFVRPIEPSDRVAVGAFLGSQETAPPVVLPIPDHAPAGLLGKLLGDIVAVVSLELAADALRVTGVVVARDLRRKWIGRAMMREVESLAAKLDRRTVVVEDPRDAGEFFRRVGFSREGERWVRSL